MAQKKANPTFTPKQRLFIAEFLVDGNGARAAIAAGYAKANAKQIASQVLKNPAIAAEIDRRIEARIQKLEIKADNVLQELGALSFANMQDYITVQDDGSAYVNLTGLSREQMAAIAELVIEEYTEGRGEEKRNVRRTKFKLADKGVNLERLGRHFKLFTDKFELKDERQQRLDELSKLSEAEIQQRIVAATERLKARTRVA